MTRLASSVSGQTNDVQIDIFGFALTAEDLAAIDAMDLGLRGGPDPDHFDLTRTTFRVED